MLEGILGGVGALLAVGVMIGILVAHRRGALLIYNALVFGTVFGLSGVLLVVATVYERVGALRGVVATDRGWSEDVVSVGFGALLVVGGVFAVRVGIAMLGERRAAPKPHWGPAPPR